jgi:beta-carotene 3-hydroxylase
VAPFVAAAIAFVLMEPLTYAAHRWVMHGAGWVLHRSHHRARPGGGLEANDWYPVLFAAVTILAMAAGTVAPTVHVLVPIGVGVTAYGAAYAFVHDVYIHGRFVRIPTIGLLERLRAAHALHHRFGGEPYGMLCPVVPGAVRDRARAGGASRPATASLRQVGTRARALKTS